MEPSEVPKNAADASTNTPTAQEVTKDPAQASAPPAQPTPPGESTGTPPEPNARPVVSKSPRFRPSRRMIILIAVVVVVLAGGGAVAWYLLSQKATPKASSAKTTATKTKATPEKTPSEEEAILAKFITPTTGEKWLSIPQKVADLGYVNPASASDTAINTYYQVGTRAESTIYLGRLQDGPGESLQLYEKAADGTVHAILHPDANETYSDSGDAGQKSLLASSVTADATTHYDSLSLPDSFDIGHGETAKVKRWGSLNLGAFIGTTATGTTKTTLHTYGGSKLVKIEHVYADTKLTAVAYSIDLPTGSEVSLTYEPISLDLSKYTWDNGTAVDTSKNADDYTMGAIIRGCGSGLFSAVSRADDVTDTDFVAAGKTADGKTVYAFKDSGNTTAQKAYDEYKDYRTGVSDVTVLSLDDFLKQHALVAYKNGAGEWLVYTRDLYAAIGGCAKPVVYLYPTHAQNVTVRVGARVNISDPLYNPTKGWTAFAQPNGQLTVGGQAYSSLFWEGQGVGAYPGITSGTIVKQSDAVATIKKQLQQQGLNQTEISDFVAYWQDKIPAKPYVRLTWFTTADMNQLAPLYVSPKPDTLIRVFLDMDGYDTLVKLPAQHLSAVPRQGFTVVEWGGLSQSVLR